VRAAPGARRARPVAILGQRRAGRLSRDQVLNLWTIAVGAGLLSLYAAGLMVSEPKYAGGAFLLGCVCLASLISLEFGIGVLVLAMLLGPEISLANLGLRDLTVRVEDLLVPVLLLAWIGRRALGLDQTEHRESPVHAALAVFLGAQVISTAFGWSAGRIDITVASFYILKQLQFFILFYFVAMYVHTELRARALLFTGLAAAVATAGYNYFIIPKNEIWTTHRISAPFEGATPEPSSIGAYFVLILGFLLALALEAPNRSARLRLLIPFAIIFVPFLFTLSRTSYVAFAGMLLLLSILTRSRWLIGGGLAALLLSPVLLPESVKQRILFTFNDAGSVHIIDRSFAERLFIWSKVWFNMQRHPVLGGGVTHHHVIDSFYARLLIESGLLGLLAFAVLVIMLYRMALAVRRDHELWWARGLALGYVTVLTALLIHAMSSITFLIVRIMEPFWAVTGIIAGLGHQLARRAHPDDSKRAPSEPGVDGAQRAATTGAAGLEISQP